MVDGDFHDAHEVYATRNGEREWIATFATQALAQMYVRAWGKLLAMEGAGGIEKIEVVPV